MTIGLALIIVSLFLIILDTRGALDGPKGLVSNLIAPMGNALSKLGDAAGGFREGGDPALRAEVDRLTQENEELLAENARLRELESEVESLRASLNFQVSRPELSYVTADVISRDPQSREKFLIINRGSDDGVQVGMPVVSPNALVGQVVDVEPGRSRVLLVIDSAFQIGGKLQNAQAEGIVYGRWQEGGRVVMRHIPYDVEVKDDDIIVTSGKTLSVPAGLVIGRVMGIDRDQAENQIEIEVLPLVEFDGLQSVTVITGSSAQPQSGEQPPSQPTPATTPAAPTVQPSPEQEQQTNP